MASAGLALEPTARRSWLPRRLDLRIAVPATILAVILAASFLAPLPYRVNATTSVLAPPSAAHLFGTDELGRDVFSRVIAGGRTDLPLVLLSTAVALLVGVPLGLLAAQRGRLAELFMRAVDVFQTFPLLVISLVFATLAGDNQSSVVLAVVIVAVPRLIRLMRAEALSVREQRFVEAASAFGASRTRIMTREVLPNVSGPILVQAALTAAQTLLVISVLSFIGIGVSPAEPSWGAMIDEGSQTIVDGQWWIAVFPGLMILLIVLCLNVLGDELERHFSRSGS